MLSRCKLVFCFPCPLPTLLLCLTPTIMFSFCLIFEITEAVYFHSSLWLEQFKLELFPTVAKQSPPPLLTLFLFYSCTFCVSDTPSPSAKPLIFLPSLLLFLLLVAFNSFWTLILIRGHHRPQERFDGVLCSRERLVRMNREPKGKLVNIALIL